MCSPKIYFARALAKDGMDSFNYFVIEEFENEQDCFDAEMFWIEFFRSNYPDYGYNLTKGGEGSTGYKHTPEAIEKFKIINKTKTLGKKHTLESKAKMSLAKLKDHDKNSIINSGTNNPNSKLDAAQLVEIDRFLSTGELSIKEMSIKFSVTKGHIWAMRRAKNKKEKALLSQALKLEPNPIH